MLTVKLRSISVKFSRVSLVIGQTGFLSVVHTWGLAFLRLYQEQFCFGDFYSSVSGAVLIW